MFLKAWQILLILSTCGSRVSAIPLADFYPFGSVAGDSVLGPTDDGSSEVIELGRGFPFFQQVYLTMVVRNGYRRG